MRGHKGALHVYSEVGKGTTLRTLLPLATGQVAKADIEEQGTAAPERFSGTVLVVDDELTVRAVAERGLQSMGLEVISAEDGREGLENSESIRTCSRWSFWISRCPTWTALKPIVRYAS